MNKNSTPLNLPERETSDSLLNKHQGTTPLLWRGRGRSDNENEAKIPGYKTANPAAYHLIKEIRDALKEKPTKEEEMLWMYLKNKKTGYHIRRQHIIDNFITDYVCLRKKLVIEIDGKIHLKQKHNDQLRTLKLNELGYKVIRFTNEEVSDNPELVALKIKKILENE